MKRLAQNTLVGRRGVEDFLSTIGAGSTPVTFTALTVQQQNNSRPDPNGGKRIPNPLAGHKIIKHNRVNGFFQTGYRDAVLRAIAKELGVDVADLPSDTFTGGTSWHEPELDDQGRLTPFAKHKKTGVRYIRYRLIKTIGEPTYIDSETGLEVDARHIKLFETPRDHYSNQPAKKKVNFLVYGIGDGDGLGIQELTIGGDTWTVDWS